MSTILIQRYSGQGKLLFGDNEAANVNYQIDEFVSDPPARPTRRGRVSHAEGHPDWHPITSLHAGPHTLVMGDGCKLKVRFENLRGNVVALGDFF